MHALVHRQRSLGAEVPLTTQDYANGVLGIVCLIGTFAVGRIIVDNVVAERKERFDRKGQPPEAVKSKETTLDGMVKIFGVAFGVYQMANTLPTIVKEVKKFL